MKNVIDTAKNRKAFQSLLAIQDRAKLNPVTTRGFEWFIEDMTQAEFNKVIKEQTEHAKLQIRVFESPEFDSPNKD